MGNKSKIKESDMLFDLVLSDKVERKIRWWCSKLPDNEWSGVLFYDYIGSFKKNNVRFTAVDFLVLDIGTSGHTEFVEDESIISYACSQGLVNQQVGLIHSHNRMNTFFSGEDTQTLIKEGSCRNHFLSLIVNNDGRYTAAITRRVSVSSSNVVMSYSTFGDSKVTSRRKAGTVVDEYIEKINLNVTVPESTEDAVYEGLRKNDRKNQGNFAYEAKDKPWKYPSLFDDNTVRLRYGRVTSVYNQIATGGSDSTAYCPVESIDGSLDGFADGDADSCVDFVNDCIEGLSADELSRLKGMFDGFDGSVYVNIVIDVIDDAISERRRDGEHIEKDIK